MTNYKQFYNAWKSFAKPKRELLLESVDGERTNVLAERFLFLTTPKKEYDLLKQFLQTGKIEIPDPNDPKKKKIIDETNVLETKEPQFDIIRRGIRMAAENPNVQDFSNLGSQTTKLVFKPQSNVYQVDAHAGRARSFANIYKNKGNLKIKISVNIIFTDGKNLDQAFNENILIKAQNQVLDSRSEKESIIPISQLIPDYNPSTNKQATTDDAIVAQKNYLNKLQDIKNQIGSGFEFVRKIRNIGGQTFKDSFTADMKLRGFIDQMFSSYKTFRIIKDNLETFDAGFGVKNLNPDALKKLREEFAEEMNKHFEITNDKGKKLIIVQERLSGGTYAFSLKLQSGETSEDDKDNVTFKAK